MKSLLNNQKCRIDNHGAGQEVKGLNGLHIHKTFEKNKKFSNAEIRIPLDGVNVRWVCTGENAEKLKRECEKALKDPEKNAQFVDVVVKEMYRFNNIHNNQNLTKEEIDDKNRNIAETVLKNGFLVTDIKFQHSENAKVFGNDVTYNYYENDSDIYKTFVGKTRFVFKGESKDNKKF